MKLALWILLLVAMIYGLFYVVGKLVVGQITPLEMTSLRFLTATPIFMAIERMTFKTRFESRGDLWKIAGLGLMGVGLVQASIAFGLKYTSVFHVGLLFGLSPLMTMIIAVLLRQEHFAVNKLAGSMVAFVGLYFLLAAKHAGSALPPTYLLGDAIILVNMVLWSLYMILSKPLLQKYPPFSLTAYAFLFATLITLPITLFAIHGIPWTVFTQLLWMQLAYIVLFATIMTYFLNAVALARVEASIVAIFIMLQPFFATIFAYFILHEVITLPMALEGLLILLGVVIATRPGIPLKPSHP